MLEEGGFALDAALELGLVALVDEEAHFKPADDEVETVLAIEANQGFEEERVEATDVGGGVGETVDEFRDIEAAAEAIDVVMQIGEGLDRFGLGDDVQVAAGGDHEGGASERLQMPRELAAGATKALGDDLDASEARGEEHADLVGVAEAALSEDDALGVVDVRWGHASSARRGGIVVGADGGAIRDYGVAIGADGDAVAERAAEGARVGVFDVRADG